MAAVLGNGRGTTATAVVTLGLAYSSALTATSLLVTGARWAGGTISAESVADGTNGAWSAAVALFGDGSTIQSAMQYFANNASTGTPTVTWSWTTSSNIQMAIAEATGIRTTAPLDKTSTNTGAATTPWTLTSGATATTAFANELWLGFVGITTTQTFAQSGDWLILSGTGLPTLRSCFVSQVVTATGTPNATVTGTANGNFAMCIATFMEPDVGGTKRRYSLPVTGVG